jgi:hypothetical protein
MNTGRSLLAGFGTATAGVGAGGYTPGPTNQNAVEEYNGSAWTAGNTLTTARRSISGTGPTESTGMVFGGNTGSVTGATEEYDGTNWTTGGSLNTAREGMGGSGSSTSGLAFSGYTTTNVTNSEEYNGTSWSEGPDVATARRFLAGSVGGTAPAALAFGGFASDDTGSTEEFHSSVSVVTAGAFASTPNLNTSYNQRSGSGITDACLCFGGEGPPGVQAINESFDGSSWSELNDLNTARSDLAGCGTQTASLAFGGSPGPGPIAKATEEWDGSSWTTSGILNQESRFCKGAGIQTAAYRVGGFISPGSGSTNAVEHYDGSSWTSQTAAPFTSNRHCALGIQTAGFVNRASPPNFASYDYNGSSWTAGPNDLQSDSQASCFGTATSSMFGSGPPTKCTVWNDTNFATSPNLGSGKGYSASFNAPSSASGMMYGQGNSSEKFTGETTAITSKTLTTS